MLLLELLLLLKLLLLLELLLLLLLLLLLSLPERSIHAGHRLLRLHLLRLLMRGVSGRVRRVLGDGHEDGHVLGARGHAARPHRGGLGATSIAAAADHGRRVHDGLLLLRRHLLELRLRLQLAHDEAGLLLVLLLELMRLLRWELLLLHGKATDGHLLLLLRVWGKER